MSGTLILPPTPTSWTSWCGACAQKWTIPSNQSSFTQFAAPAMSSRPVEPRSIASQLVVLFALAATFLLCCGLGTLYWIVVRHAFEEDNEVLADKLAAVRADLTMAAGLNVVTQEMANARAGERAAYWVRVLNPTGQTLAETPGMSELLPVNVFPEADAKRSPKDFRNGGRLFSLLTGNQDLDARRFVIQVAQDRTADERFMKQFAALLGA